MQANNSSDQDYDTSRSVFYCSAGVKANFNYKKLKNSQCFNSKLTASIRAERSKMS